ncbi:MAG: radical SAM protein [Myxococcales bacterium]|nr:radical SAM protein [Myxococcales bacterium]
MSSSDKRTAILYIAERCNQSCVFCLEEDGQWNEFIDPTTQQVFDVLARLRDRGARHITFMGGETFFRKDLPRIIARAKELGYTRVGVTTNGTVLSKAGFIGRLRDAGLDFIELSIHGHDEALANAIARTGHTFARQQQAMAEIDATGDLLTIVNVVICRENKDHLIDVAAHVRASLPRVPIRFKLKFVSLQGWAADRAGEGDALGYDEVDFVAVGDYLAGAGADFWFYNVPLCRLGRHARRAHELSTLAVGESYFDLDHRGTSDYYDTGHQLEGRVWPAEPCRPCTLRAICPGLEEQHRRARGAGALVTRSDDPRPLVEFALADRGEDPGRAAARLEELARQPRPETFARERADGALRFRHPAEGQPFDVEVEPRRGDAPGYFVGEHLRMGYRTRSAADRNPGPEIRHLLEAVAEVVRRADAEGLSIEEARRAALAAAPSPWVAEVSARPEQERKKRPRLPLLGAS